MAVAAASLPRPAQFSNQQQDDDYDGKRGSAQQKQYTSAVVNGTQSKVLINPIAAYSQQLADKQLHIARITDDAVHWQRKEVNGDARADADLDTRRDGAYFKDKLFGRLSKKSSDSALSGGILDREFGDNEYKAAAAQLDVGGTTSIPDGFADSGNTSITGKAGLHSINESGKVNGHITGKDNHRDGQDGMANGHTLPPSDRLFKSDMPLPSPAGSSNAPSESHTYISDTPSAYATPIALAPTPSPTLEDQRSIQDALSTTSLPEQDELQTKRDPPAGRENVTTEKAQARRSSALESASDAGPDNSAFQRADEPRLYMKTSATLSRQQQDKKAPPPLSSLQFLPQANVIPPTPPTASTSASFSEQADILDRSTIPSASQSQQQQPGAKRTAQHQPASPRSRRTPSSPSSAQPPQYLSPETIRKTSPSHRRSQSYQPTTTAARSSTSSAGTVASSNVPLVTPPLSNSQPPRRSSLLPPITTSPALNALAADARKRSLSPRRGLSFRGGGSGTALPTPGGPLYDEPMSMEEQAEQKRQADQLDETIARQAEQIRKERLSKRIESQRAHEKALASLREEEEARRDRGEDTGASALVSGSPPGRDGIPSPLASSAGKGKDRERGDTTSTIHTQDASPASPSSVHKQLWSSSPVAGEKAVLRADSAAAEKAGYSKEKVESSEPDRVLVGNLIGEDHVNYVLMYNMLTGIRIGVSLLHINRPFICPGRLPHCFHKVSRCEAKNHRPLTDADYTAQHKFSFDMYVTNASFP